MQRTASENFHRFLAWWVDGVRRFALVVVLAAAVVTVALSYYTAQTLTIDTDTADMLSRELPFRQHYIEYQQEFPQFSDTITVVVEAETADRADAAARRLAERLRHAPNLIQTVADIAGDPFFDRNGLLYLDPEDLQDLSDRLAEGQALLATLAADPSLRGLFDVLGLAVEDALAGGNPPGDLAQVFDRIAAVAAARAAGEPRELSWRSLLTGEGESPADSRRFIQVKPVIDWSSLAPAAKAIEGIRHIAVEMGFDESTGVRVRLTGGAALATEELQSVFKGATLAGIISFVLVTVLLFVGLRSVRLVAATSLTLIAGLIWTAGFVAAAIGHLNLISVAFAVLFIGLAIDFGIHFALRFKEEVNGGKASSEALRRTAIGVGGSLTLAAVSAAISFYSFLPTAYQGLAELGLISGTGMFIALFANFTLLPALLTIFGLRSAPRPMHVTTENLHPEAVIRRHGGAIVAGALAIGVAAAAFVPQVRFDLNPLHLQDPTTESVQTALDLLAVGEASPQTISILAKDREEAAALAQRLEKLDTVANVVWLADLVPDRQETKLDIIADMAIVLTPILMQSQPPATVTPAENKTALVRFLEQLDTLQKSPEAPREIARSARNLLESLEPFGNRPEDLADLDKGLLGLFPQQLERLREAMTVSAPITIADLPEALRDRYLADDGRLRVEVIPAEDISDNDTLRRFVEAVLSVAPQATDTPVIVLKAGDAVIHAILQASATAVVLISILLLALLRSVRDMLLVLFPLALAAMLTLATTVLIGTPFNFANLIVLPLLLGLGVASGIHLVMRARAERAGTALMQTSTPRAVVFSALTTIGSFGSLALSTHRGTASMGELLTIAIGYTLICTLIVLPALMAWLDRRRQRPDAA